jgi:hypothetical protein
VSSVLTCITLSLSTGKLSFRGEFRCETSSDSDSVLSVEPVDRCLVRLSACPHRKWWGGREECGAVQIKGSRFQHVDEVVIGPQVVPGEIGIVGPEHSEVRPGLSEFGQVLKPELVGALCDASWGPQVNLAQMAKEISHVPVGTGRNVSVNIAVTRGSEQLPFGGEDVDVLSDVHVFLP